MKIDIGCNISDAALLRALAEDVPDMALSVREKLREIADVLSARNYQGEINCRRCGWKAQIDIQQRGLE